MDCFTYKDYFTYVCRRNSPKLSYLDHSQRKRIVRDFVETVIGFVWKIVWILKTEAGTIVILLLVFVVEHATHFSRKISVFARKKAKSLVTRYSTRILRLKKSLYSRCFHWLSSSSTVTSSPMRTNGAQYFIAANFSDSLKHFIARWTATLAQHPRLKCL